MYSSCIYLVTETENLSYIRNSFVTNLSLLTSRCDIVINYPKIVIVDLEVEISVAMIDIEMARPGVEILTDLIATVIDVMADSGMVTGLVMVTGPVMVTGLVMVKEGTGSETVTVQIGRVTLTGATGHVTLLTEERGFAMTKDEIGTMMKKEMMIKLGIVTEMTVKEDVMMIDRERGRLLMTLEIVNMRTITRKTEVETGAMKSNVTSEVVVRIIILSRNSNIS